MSIKAQDSIYVVSSSPGGWYLKKVPLSGVIGATGSTGLQGIAGATGGIGNTGVTGGTGSNGSNGSNGATGGTGTNGSNGSAGVTGSTGAAAFAYTRIPGSAPTTFTEKFYSSTRLTNGSGVIIDTLTTNGVATGTAIFTHIYSVQLSGKYAGSIVSIPLQGYTVAGNLKTITVNVGSGTILSLLGATILAVSSGIEVSILIVGD